MAIGDNNYSGSSNNYNNKPYENTYYSRISFKNGDRYLKINYHSGLMQLEIGNVSNTDGFRFNQEGTIYLSAIKANMLSEQISQFLAYRAGDDIDPNKAFGVNAGMNEKITFIGFSTDADKKIYVTIGKFDTNGVITEKTRFEMQSNYNYSLEWDNLETNDLTKVYYNDIEIKMLQQAFADFCRGQLGASAYGVVDMARWDIHRNNKRIDQIFDKLGIERQSYGTSSRSFGTNNFLSGASSTTKNFEDVEDLLAD